MDDLAVKAAGHVEGRIVFDVFRAAQLACLVAVRQLSGCVRVERRVAKQRDLLDTRFQPFILAVLVAQRRECFLQDVNAEFVGRHGDGPEDAGLPPLLGIAGRPSDTIIVGRGRTRDTVIARRQVRKFGGVHVTT